MAVYGRLKCAQGLQFLVLSLLGALSTQLCARLRFQLRQMKPIWRPALALGLLVSALWVTGCGGGSSGPSPVATRTPVPTGTPVTNNLIVVRLSDSGGLAVDGVVNLTVGLNVYHMGTTGGQASFVGFAAGTYSLSAQVNGQTQTRPVPVASGTTTVDFVFSAGVTPAPTATIPAPPFGTA